MKLLVRAIGWGRKKGVLGLPLRRPNAVVPDRHPAETALPKVTNAWRHPVSQMGPYAEELFWNSGVFGGSEAAEAQMLRSYRFRIRRVFYDANVERGTWTLQQAADWRAGTPRARRRPVRR